MTGLAIYHLVAGAGLTALGLHTLLNHLTLPRLQRMRAPGPLPRISVLIPARNEAERIGACVGGWAAQAYPDYEVVVYDDESTDDTVARALAAAGSAPHVRVIRGERLPEGWRGKPWACHRLRSHARGELLVFADADVFPGPTALARTASALDALGADALSALPVHEGGSLGVRALVGLQNWAALAFVPSWLPAARRCRWLAAMTGQFIAIRADVYDACGGFAAARGSLAEDAALGRLLVAGGFRVRLVDGARVLRCRPYATVGPLWRASARNLLPVFFDSPALLLLALAGLGALCLGPLAVLGLGAILGRGGWLWTWLPLAEVALAIIPRAVSDLRAGYAPWLALLHPFAVAALGAMGLDSIARFRLRRVVEWRDRQYDVAA
jgi:chlorobactene glucosyltransferase